MRMSEIIRHQYAIFTTFIDAILASSPGTLDIKATFAKFFVLKYEKAGGQNCRGNLSEWRIDDARANMREDTTSKVPTESWTSV